MKISIYSATVAHDKGKSKFKVVSLNGREGAINIIMAMEQCPRSAISKIIQIKERRRNRTKGVSRL
jgi:hypothetical protein